MRSYPAAFLGLLILFSSAAAADRPAVDPELLRFTAHEAVARVTGAETASAADATMAPLPEAVSVEHGRAFADVWIGGDVDPQAVRELGGRVNTIAGGLMTARIPLDAVSRLVALPGIERIQLGQRVELQADMMVADIGVDDVWGGPPPSFPTNGITGKNTVIGIVDTGIDPYHGDFWFGGSTRIRFVWDQSNSAGPFPSGFGYGTQYTAAQINARTCPNTDLDGHGTHIAGVAAGNGGGTGNGQPAYRYPGVAPGADLVVVKLRPLPNGTITDDKILDGVRYVFDRAAELGKPAVVVLAVGKTSGPHDGDDPLDLGISALVGPGRIVCAAAGNYGGEARHAELAAMARGQTGNLTLSIPTYPQSAVAADIVEAEAWHGPDGNFTVSIVTPLGQEIGPVALGGSTAVNSAAGIVEIGNGTFTSSNGSRRVFVRLYRGSLTYPALATGTWTLKLVSQGSPSRVDSWLTYYRLGGTKPGFVGGMTERCLIASPASANQVTSVAAYSTRRYWTAINGQRYGFADARVGEIAKFSSPGPRRDGIPVPHLAAPGFSVASSKASGTYPSTMYLMPDSVHAIGYGTSVAAASVGGAIALKLQNNPQMTPEQASSLRYQAMADAYTGTVPNDSWGWGKLHLPTPVADVDEIAGGSLEFALASQNPARGAVSFTVQLARTDFEAGARVAIHDVSGREVASLPIPAAGPQQVTWAGRSGGTKAPAGVYWARLNSGGRTWTRSFVWLR